MSAWVRSSSTSRWVASMCARTLLLVIERALRFAAVACSLLVIAGWGWFAIDEAGTASANTQAEIAGQQASRAPSPDPDQERDREKVNSSLHEYVDDANDVLLKPF